MIVAAAGNQGKVGSTAITRHPWVIPVIACNNHGQPLQLSNLGSSIGRKGLSAPGEDITSLGSENNTVTFSGTSVAAPFVTGIIALLRSEFPGLSASAIKQAMKIENTRRSLIPPLVNAMASFQYLNSFYRQKAIA
jgi:subtilisin family serine protease